MEKSIHKYLSEIGRRGGKNGRRDLSREDAIQMVRIREARRAFKKYWAQCFWSYDKNYVITKDDIPWVAEQLIKNGNRDAFYVGEKLCR